MSQRNQRRETPQSRPARKSSSWRWVDDVYAFFQSEPTPAPMSWCRLVGRSLADISADNIV
jgi:hypothetical protein